MLARRRRGVAAVVGTVIFVIVFMMATGTMAYISGQQAETSQAEQSAMALASAHASESLAFESAPSGLIAVDTGPSSVAVNHAILKFPNGTVYALPVSLVLATGAGIPVSNMIPSQVCTPGGATCLSKYKSIVSGASSGSSVGLLTSLGNVFWYVPTTSRTGAGNAVAVGTATSTSGSNNYVSTGLVVTLAGGAEYVFYAFTAVSPSFGTEQFNFEIHSLPAGATLVIACSPMAYPIGGGNQPTKCVTSTGAPIALNPFAFGVTPPVYETPGIFGVVSMGSASGPLQVDFACVGNCGSVTMNAGSFLMVEPVG